MTWIDLKQSHVSSVIKQLTCEGIALMANFPFLAASLTFEQVKEFAVILRSNIEHILGASDNFH